MPRMSDNMLLKRPEQAVLFLRYETNMAQFSQLIGEGFKIISDYLKELREEPTDTPYVLYQGFEEMTKQNIIMEIGFHTAKSFPPKGDIKSKLLPETNIIVAYYRGNYEEMGLFYIEMTEWAKKEELNITGDSFEYYINGPNYPLENMLTKVVMPVK